MELFNEYVQRDKKQPATEDDGPKTVLDFLVGIKRSELGPRSDLGDGSRAQDVIGSAVTALNIKQRPGGIYCGHRSQGGLSWSSFQALNRSDKEAIEFGAREVYATIGWVGMKKQESTDAPITNLAVMTWPRPMNDKDALRGKMKVYYMSKIPDEAKD